MTTSTATAAKEFTGHSAFLQVFDGLTNVLGYDAEWANGTGYFDHICGKDLGLEPGAMAASTDMIGRKIIIIGTPLGNVAVFQRYSDGSAVIVVNTPPAIRHASMVSDGQQDYYAVMDLLGMAGQVNIGDRLKYLNKALKHAEAK